MGPHKTSEAEQEAGRQVGMVRRRRKASARSRRQVELEEQHLEMSASLSSHEEEAQRLQKLISGSVDTEAEPAARLTLSFAHACDQCRKVKARCCGSFPCDRCFRLLLPCKPILVKQEPEEAQECVQGLPMLNLIYVRCIPKGNAELFIQAFNHFYQQDRIDRQRVLRWIHTWHVMSVSVDQDISWSIIEVITKLLNISTVELEGAELLALGAPASKRKEIAQKKLQESHSEMEVLKQSKNFHHADTIGSGTPMVMSFVHNKSPLYTMAANANYERLFKPAFTFMLDCLQHKTLPPLLSISWIAPEDRYAFLLAVVEVLFTPHTPKRHSQLYKTSTSTGAINLLLVEGGQVQTEDGWGYWMRLEPAPTSRHITPNPQLRPSIMAQFRDNSTSSIPATWMSNVGDAVGDGGAGGGGGGGGGGGTGLAAFAAFIPPMASVNFLPFTATNGNALGQEDLAQQLARAERIFPKVNGIPPMEGQAFSALLYGQQEAELRQEDTAAAARSYTPPPLPLPESFAPLSTVDHCQEMFSLPMEVESAASPSVNNGADMMPRLIDDPILNELFAPAAGEGNNDEFSLFK